MTPLQAAIGYTAGLLVTAAFAGVMVRRRYRNWYAFTCLLGVISLVHLLIGLWPTRFYTQGFWMAQEITTNVLRFATALELALRTFRFFPGARRTLRLAVLLVVTIILIRVIEATPVHMDLRTYLSHVHPHILNGSVWLFTVIAGFILWYRLPVDPFHKRVLLGWVPYLLTFTVATRAISSDALLAISLYVNQLAFVVLAGYWAYLAWEREPSRGSAEVGARPKASAMSPAL